MENRVQSMEAVLKDLLTRNDRLSNKLESVQRNNFAGNNVDQDIRYRLETSLRQAEEHVLYIKF